MPRIARKNLNTPFMHVMVQGINKEYIFDDEKYLKEYLSYIKDIKSNEKFTLIAYCMMNNHAHFLFYISDLMCFEKYMHKNNLRFAQNYNKEMNRCGVVFRNRYQIEPIYKIKHLINCIKYIHNNPVKAKIVEKCEDYPYSSYRDYLNNTGVAESDILKEIFGCDKNYLDIISQSCDRNFIDYDNKKNIKEFIEAGIVEFIKINKINIVEILCQRKTLIKMIIFLKEECNITYHDIVEYFKISRGVYNKILMEINSR